MRTRKLAYWVSTGFVAAVMTISGTIVLWHGPRAVQALAHLGYPAYFGYILGTAKLLGVFVLLAPGRGPIKEWTYAGFGIILISACISHYVSGDGFASLDPFFFLILLVLSYGTRPGNRRSIPRASVESAAEPEGAR
jgi:hypothetical protein